MSKYVVPTATRIGHVHLKVSDLQRALDFYCGLLGFELRLPASLVIRLRLFLPVAIITILV